MQINFNNGTSFNGIKLSSNDYDKTRILAKELESYGYSCLGYKTFICNNTANDKISLAQKIRNKAYFFQTDLVQYFCLGVKRHTLCQLLLMNKKYIQS